MSYSYKDGYREGVAFIFYKDGEVLLEHRPTDNGKDDDTFFPSGSIEEKDHCYNTDYKTIALLREINEEYMGNVEVKNYYYLGKVCVESIKLIFYSYAIIDWKGEFPDYSIEEGKQYAKLQWIKLKDKESYSKYDSFNEICDLLYKFLSKDV